VLIVYYFMCISTVAKKDSLHFYTFKLFYLSTTPYNTTGHPVDRNGPQFDKNRMKLWDGQLRNLDSISGRHKKCSSLPIASRPALGLTKPLIRWVPRAVSSEKNRPEREANHSPPPSAKIKNGGAIPPVLHTSS
jgi:hypothetical protein